MKSAGLWAALAALMVAALPSVSRAVLVADVRVPGITGEDSPPGFAGAMRTESVTVGTGSLSMIKRVDSATPQIANAIVAGTHLGTSRVLLYNSSPPAGAPDASLSLVNTLADSQTLLGGSPATENDSFTTATPARLYLEIPGIVGPF